MLGLLTENNDEGELENLCLKPASPRPPYTKENNNE